MNESSRPLQRLRRIFSGKYSKDLWKAINKTKPKKTQWALYDLGCHCQELETQVHALESRIAQLEDR